MESQKVTLPKTSRSKKYMFGNHRTAGLKTKWHAFVIMSPYELKFDELIKQAKKEAAREVKLWKQIKGAYDIEFSFKHVKVGHPEFCYSYHFVVHELKAQPKK